MKEKVILNRMKAGDEEAFAWLYNHYWQKVYHFARLYLTSSSEISEAVQDVFCMFGRQEKPLTTARILTVISLLLPATSYLIIQGVILMNSILK